MKPWTPVATPQEYARDAAGHYVAGPSWLAHCTRPPTLAGWVLWGEPDEPEIDRLVATVEMLWSGIARLPVVLDGRALVRIDPLAFARLAGWVELRRARIAESVTRIAVLHGSGVPGATAAGFVAAVRLSPPARAFTDIRDVPAWLERPDAAALLDAVDRLGAEVRGGTLVDTVVAYLEAHPASPIARVAAALALSTRSLQRRLLEHGTTFQRVSDAARVRVAQGLLRDSNASFKRVALEVGCASHRELTRLFRRVVRQSPAEWRGRVRG